ncbi:hypothetical protein N185_15905 [Sinorhizobium sp. GW3]|nr:hypothetical protein N185_15905 [Sinorhizobium sp. GW3]
MAEFFLGQIMMGGYNFPPRGFAYCNGQILSIAQNQALFSLLRTLYGGNGTTNFALPNMQGRTPVSFGSSVDPSWQPAPYPAGARDGAETVTLTTDQIPAHVHVGRGVAAAGKLRNPENALYGTAPLPIYAPTGEAQVPLSSQTVAPAGGGQPHSNVQPYSAINFCIALTGIYPSRN